MKQVLAIFKKDVHRLWIEIATTLAIMIAFVIEYPITWREAELFGMRTSGLMGFISSGNHFLPESLVVLIPLVWWILIGRLVQVEALVGDRQFWLTRPYKWQKLIAAKALFLAVFLYAPFFLAQCALLVEAGFNPLHYLFGLLRNLVITTVILVLPMAAISTLTSGIGKLTLILLGIALYIGAAAYLVTRLPFEITSPPSGSLGGTLSFVVVLCGCVAIVLVQYAMRELRIAWPILGATCLLLTCLAIINPDRWLMDRQYPVQSAVAASSIGFDYSANETRMATTSPAAEKDVYDISVPLRLRGISPGVAIQPMALKAAIDVPGGAHWESAWQSDFAGYRSVDLLDFNESFKIRRADYERFKGVPVTLHLMVAVRTAKSSTDLQLPFQPRDFAVAGVGICTPQRSSEFGAEFTGINCRSALRQPQLTYVTGYWSEGACPAEPSPANSIAGSAWVGDLSTDSAAFGITSVWLNHVSLSNGFKSYRPIRVRRLCPGSPMRYTTYESDKDEQITGTLENFRLPAVTRYWMTGILSEAPRSDAEPDAK